MKRARLPLLLLASAVGAWAQFTSLRGSVVDPTGAVIANAEVRLFNLLTGAESVIRTDPAGRFSTAELPFGKYRVQVRVPRFRMFEREVDLSPNATMSFDIRLTRGETATPRPAPPPTPQPTAVPPPPPTAVPTPLPPSEAPRVSLTPTWNVWAESFARQPAFEPKQALETEKPYLLVVDLAALAYEIQGVTSRSTDRKLAEWLRSASTGTATIEVLVLPDLTYFYPLDDPRTGTLTIQLEQVNRVLQGDVRKLEQPFALLKKEPRPEFVFDRVAFPIRTRQKEGRGSITLSFWKEGMVPIDELSVTFCITPAGQPPACQNKDVVVSSFNGVQVLSPAGRERPLGDPPAVALHFVEISPSRAAGVLRLPEWEKGRYETWPIENLTESLTSFLDGAFLKNFYSATNETSRFQTGTELYNLLFPPGAAATARALFEQLLASPQASASPAASLWIRLLPRDARFPYAVPLGALAVMVNGEQKFVGKSFRLDTPLPVLDYRPVANCIADWVMVLPPNAAGTLPELTTARHEFQEWTGLCPGPRCKEDFAEFRKWIGAAGPEPTSTALLILAHHTRAGVSFDQLNTMSEQGVVRSFQEPSVAVLNACGTAGPGAYEFVRKLSAKGVSAIIAPVTEVDAEMAGRYTSVLAATLAKHKDEPAYTLSHAHLETLRSLDSKYGSLALTFVLLGNGNLRLCAPPRKPEP